MSVTIKPHLFKPRWQSKPVRLLHKSEELQNVAKIALNYGTEIMKINLAMKNGGMELYPAIKPVSDTVEYAVTKLIHGVNYMVRNELLKRRISKSIAQQGDQVMAQKTADAAKKLKIKNYDLFMKNFESTDYWNKINLFPAFIKAVTKLEKSLD